jgi:hypothetical protein
MTFIRKQILIIAQVVESGLGEINDVESDLGEINDLETTKKNIRIMQATKPLLWH